MNKKSNNYIFPILIIALLLLGIYMTMNNHLYLDREGVIFAQQASGDIIKIESISEEGDKITVKYCTEDACFIETFDKSAFKDQAHIDILEESIEELESINIPESDTESKNKAAELLQKARAKLDQLIKAREEFFKEKIVRDHLGETTDSEEPTPKPKRKIIKFKVYQELGNRIYPAGGPERLNLEEYLIRYFGPDYGDYFTIYNSPKRLGPNRSKYTFIAELKAAMARAEVLRRNRNQSSERSDLDHLDTPSGSKPLAKPPVRPKPLKPQAIKPIWNITIYTKLGCRPCQMLEKKYASLISDPRVNVNIIDASRGVPRGSGITLLPTLVDDKGVKFVGYDNALRAIKYIKKYNERTPLPKTTPK